MNFGDLTVDEFLARYPSYAAIPRYTLDALYRYIRYGIAPGDSLASALAGNFVEAVCRADYANRPVLHLLVMLIENHTPHGCHRLGNRCDQDVCDQWREQVLARAQAAELATEKRSGQ